MDNIAASRGTGVDSERIMAASRRQLAEPVTATNFSPPSLIGSHYRCVGCRKEIGTGVCVKVSPDQVTF